MEMVKAAFEKIPSEATADEQEAVNFFYKNVVATLENTVTTDAMCGKSVMEALDVKTMIIRSQEEVLLARKATKKLTEEEEKMKGETRNLMEANVWVATMATAALLMDERMGASHTESIVHNMIRTKEESKKRPKQFKKGMATLRGAIYMEHYGYFMKIWVDNQGIGCEAAARLAQWDDFTGMTKHEVMSDAQKRARRMPKCPDEDKENKKRKLDEGPIGGFSKYFFKKIDTNETVPPLTGMGSDGGSSNGTPSSSTSAAEYESLMEEQNAEVMANPTTQI